MRRIQNQRQAEAIARGLAFFPSELRRRVEGVDVFFGDPIFAGLHRDGRVAGKRADGSPFTLREAAHFTWPDPHPWFDVDRPTIVVPYRQTITPWDVVHEFAHALDYFLGRPSARLRVAPITRYAQTSPTESFAEATSAWLTAHHLHARDGWRAWIRRWAPQFPAFLNAVASPERGFRGP